MSPSRPDVLAACRLTGLTRGYTIDVGIFASTGVANWAANGANAAGLFVSYLCLR